MSRPSPPSGANWDAAPGALDRREVMTLLFTDLVGSTRLKEDLGNTEALRLIHEHHGLVRSLLQEYPDGLEVSTAGDSFFLAFRKPSDAVAFALRLQALLHGWNRRHPRKVLDRIGIHAGEVTVESDPHGRIRDLHGLEVDKCARVMSLARENQILLTHFAFDNARASLKGRRVPDVADIQWATHGAYELKGVADPVEICEVTEIGRTDLAPPPDSEKARRLATGSEPRAVEAAPSGWRGWLSRGSLTRRPAMIGGIVAAAIGLGLLVLPLFRPLSDLSYDLAYLIRPIEVPADAVIVRMDPASEETLGQPGDHRWERRIHAELIRKLARLGARAIVLDIWFADPGTPAEDEALIEAVKAFGKVAVAGRLIKDVQHQLFARESVHGPFPALAAVAHWGLSQYPVTLDQVARRPHPGTHDRDHLAFEVARMMGRTNLPPARGLWLNYYGPPGTFESFGYSQVLTNLVPAERFTNRIVFVGAVNLNKPGFTEGWLNDEGATPYTRWTGELSPGVEIVATSTLNLLRGDWLRRLSPWMEALIVAATGLAAGFGLCLLRPMPAVVAGLLVALVVAAGAVWSVWTAHIWFPWLIVAGIQIPVAVAWSALAWSQAAGRSGSAPTPMIRGSNRPPAGPTAGDRPRQSAVPDHVSPTDGRPKPMRCLWGICASLLVLACQAGEPAPQAVVVSVVGKVEFHPAGSATWYPVATNHVLFAGDTLRTATHSRATLLLRDQSVLPLRESSMIQLLERQDNVVLRLIHGILSFFHRDEPGQIEVEGGGLNASVRGTEFVFEVRDDSAASVTLIDGVVDLADGSGHHLPLQSGDVAVIRSGEPMHKAAVLTAGDWSPVQWVLHYPAILDPEELPGFPPESALRESWDRYREGDLPGAMAAFPAGRAAASPAEEVFLAALLLSVGSVDEARLHLDAVPADSPVAGLASAHRGLIDTILRGETSSGPVTNSATAALAASYTLQARHDLPGALLSARNAIAISPRFGFAWVRRAELEFILGDPSRAEFSLAGGMALVPRDAEAHAVRGFLFAARNRVTKARAAFDAALGLDSALADAWLGRGLCRIREGDLDGGRADLLVAAASEPQRAALRSYLGKAFAESRVFHATSLEAKARHELELARRMDPGDPTPWLYSALLNQRANRLNDAIDDLEQSIALNGNRAVYRSRLGLDEDRAVRGANLAAIYQDAGLDIFALRQATRAVEDRATSFSAHQFLADSYNAVRDPDQVQLRYESAWFSEYLLANLLAPVGAGRLSTTIAPNEYSRFFERDGPGLAGRTTYWSNGDWQQNASQFGTFGNFGYAVDVFYRSTQGLRINDDAEQLSLSVQAKEQLGFDDSVFVQALYADASFGDVASYFNWSDANPDLRATDRQQPQLLAGWHHAWAPGSDTLFLVARLNDQYTVSNPHAPETVVFRNADDSVFSTATAEAPLEYRSTLDAWSVEAQHLWQNDPHTLVAGLRYQTGTFDTTSDLGPTRALGLAVPALAQDIDSDLGRFSAYAYEHWQVLDWLRLSAGLSYDWLRQPVNYRVPPVTDGSESTDHVSPKVGLTLSPWRGGILRAAYTRSLGGVSFDQSFRLEPSQIAGFTQTFRGLIPESIAGSVAGQQMETWGTGFEQVLATRTYLTLALERLGSDAARTLGTREIRTGQAPTAGGLGQRLEFEERNLMFTAHQLAGRDLAFGVNYRLSDASLRDAVPDLGGSARRVSSLLHQLTLDAHLAHPSGFFAIAEAVWTHQSNDGYEPVRPAEDFWHLNVYAGWRFLDRNLEITAGILNLTDQDYRLNPLNDTREPYRDRTFTTSLRFDF